MTPTHITDANHPAVLPFRDVKERDLTGREGLFIAEGEVVLNVLLSPSSLCRPVAVLIAQKRLEGLLPLLANVPPGVPVYTAEQEILDQIAGFHLHRGILAIGQKPDLRPVAEVVEGLVQDGARATLVVASGIGNHDNIGGIFRNAAAFGADAVLMDSGCCDPFYRKAIRVSVGAVLRTPMARAATASEIVLGLQEKGFEVLALTPSAVTQLADYRPGRRVALLLGSEGPGLPKDVIEQCTPVGIRMAGGFDSLNVAVTSGIALHHITTGVR
ncbi:MULTISPECIES: TrmH family RNA methyltransferase [unclassified Brevundimonas]|uniref:TrmH family RNA methyltransferase n=1 Tax=unclassified Brevundimonas TaxID=2622653 RepID=UPI0025BC254D|nr:MULTISPECIES: RNA methyltransferase [unclassified Brevundimonas]